MNQNEELSKLITAAFPVEPRPTRFFSAEGMKFIELDIPQELRTRIAGRPWTEVTLMDWRMTGTSPVVARSYLEPATFMYYVPSILSGTIQQPEFIDYALEGIIPNNRTHVPRGTWWLELSKEASPNQRAALVAFLAYVRFAFWDKIGSANRNLLEHGETIWSG
jgi:hypothetical protein